MKKETYNGWSNRETRYKIIRFYRDRNKLGYPGRAIRTGLTLEEAQEHCQRDDTAGEGWFDGYTEE